MATAFHSTGIPNIEVQFEELSAIRTVNRRRTLPPNRRPKLIPGWMRVRTAAIAPAKLVGVAQPGRARVCEERLFGTLRGSISAEAAGRNDCLKFSEVEVADRVQRLGGGAVL